jgi:hypothetical protein
LKVCGWAHGTTGYELLDLISRESSLPRDVDVLDPLRPAFARQPPRRNLEALGHFLDGKEDATTKFPAHPIAPDATRHRMPPHRSLVEKA